MVRVYAILAHPNKDSLSGRLFYSTVQHLEKQGAIVDVLDLYEHADRIPLYSRSLESNAFFQENKQRFMNADRLFIVYPVYWYAVPGALKCWLDLITNFAWKYDGGRAAKPLHSIKKLLIVNSANMPNWVRWFFTRNSATEMVRESFKWMGVTSCKVHEIGNAHKTTAEQAAAHQTKIIKKSDWLLQ